VNDSAMTLLGESQEDDRRQIADLVIAKMQHCLKPVSTTIRYFLSQKYYIIIQPFIFCGFDI